MTSRHALYFAPEDDDPLGLLGAGWLGRDARTGDRLDRPALEGWDDATLELEALTAAPRRYGFHGTLKAPFALAEGRTTRDLEAAAETFAAETRSFDIPRLAVTAIGPFLALTPPDPCPELDRLAADCVRRFDTFRAPPPPQETARRLAHGLTKRQAAHLERWGYPYVMEDFRFHLTLTDGIGDADDRASLRRDLEALFAPVLREQVRVTSLCLFRQPGGNAPFRLVRRFPFGG
ncbi:DUF1045 domain-containing protein [Inquilinus sp. CAU 1745]|uniref:DUF1045 domain-containing protein n=1 Tax=Inquilinus sp. CAU 1745 TaxID=3140369 RepID=UPI00325BF4AC